MKTTNSNIILNTHPQYPEFRYSMHEEFKVLEPKESIQALEFIVKGDNISIKTSPYFKNINSLLDTYYKYFLNPPLYRIKNHPSGIRFHKIIEGERGPERVADVTDSLLKRFGDNPSKVNRVPDKNTPYLIYKRKKYYEGDILEIEHESYFHQKYFVNSLQEDTPPVTFLDSWEPVVGGMIAYFNNTDRWKDRNSKGIKKNEYIFQERYSRVKVSKILTDKYVLLRTLGIPRSISNPSYISSIRIPFKTGTKSLTLNNNP
jgi:hypothetical protein